MVEQLDISVLRYIVENLERVIKYTSNTETGVLAAKVCATDIHSLVE